MIGGKIDNRKKIKADPSQEYVEYICGLYGDAYDDREEDSKPQGRNWNPGERANHKSLEGFRKQLKGSYDIELSTAKIRKILITGGRWSTERSREIQKKFSELKSVSLVAESLGLSAALVVMNIPYEKVVYDLEDKSGNAKRVERWRNKSKEEKTMFNIENELKDYSKKINSLIEKDLGKRNEICSALAFIRQELNVSNISDLLCKIVITDCFLKEYNKIHYQPSNINPNGITIAPCFQSESYLESTKDKNRTVILINDNKISCCHTDFYKSVIVHELSHCADFVFKLPEFIKRYGVQLEKAVNEKVSGVIGGYFSAYTEVRAKYMQEMYLVELHNPGDYMDIFYKKDKDAFGNIINKYNIESLDNQTGAEFEYRAQHCAGKIRCWEKMFIEKPIYGYDDKYKTIIEKIKKNYLYRSKHGEFVTDMYEVWDWNLLIKKCDKVMKDFDGNIDADVPKDYSVNIK